MGYFYAKAKHRQSGTTMQQNKPPGAQGKWSAARVVLAGYPAEPFTSLEDIEAYIGGDRVACLICGKHYRKLLVHVRMIHQLDGTDYRTRFNIPAKYNLCADDVIDAAKAHAQRPDNLAHMVVLGRAQALGRLTRRKPSVVLRTTFSRDSNNVGLRKIAEFDLRARNASDCSWHLQHVASHYGHRSITPPEGELSWSAYKKRRKVDPVLQAAHQRARDVWRAEKRGGDIPGARSLTVEQRHHFVERVRQGLELGEMTRLAQEWGVSAATLSRIKKQTA